MSFLRIQAMFQIHHDAVCFVGVVAAAAAASAVAAAAAAPTQPAPPGTKGEFLFEIEKTLALNPNT